MNSSAGRGIRVPPYISRGTVVVNQLKGEKRKRYASPSEDEIEQIPLAHQSQGPSSHLHSSDAEAEHTFDEPMASAQYNESIEESQADNTEETENPESEKQLTPTQSRAVVRSPTPVRQYAQRERPILNYSSQMSRIAYPRSYRQYRPKPPKKQRAASVARDEPEQPNETEQDRKGPGEQHEPHGARNNATVADHSDFIEIDDPLPITPIRPPGNLPTPDTRRSLRPRWQETTSSQIGVPYDGLDDQDIEPVWEDSIIDVYDESELPKRTNVGWSRITSSILENCETKNVKMVHVAALNNRRLEDMEVIGLDDRRLKYRRLEGKAVDLEKFSL